jgi:formylglycine-generating enzyme required for sulfatase activity
MPHCRPLILAPLLILAGLPPLFDLLTNPATAHGLSHAAPVPKHLISSKEREFEIAENVSMKFCWIPPGKATLGSPKEEQDRCDDEAEHEYTTNGFWLGKYLVIQAEWQAVMGNNPSEFDGNKDNEAKGLDTSRFPVDRVSWKDCQNFLKRINSRVGIEKVFGTTGKFVLPEEDQWEYACRGGMGNKRAFYFGNQLNGTQANCDGREPYGTDKKGDYKGRTTEVGSYAKDWPHPWGLCDMSGNVWQWCDKREQSDSGPTRWPGNSPANPQSILTPGTELRMVLSSVIRTPGVWPCLTSRNLISS